MLRKLRVLTVVNSDNSAAQLLDQLRATYQATSELPLTPADCHTKLQKQQWDLIIADTACHQIPISELLTLLKQQPVQPPLILLVDADIDQKSISYYLQTGAQEIIYKDRPAQLLPMIERLLKNTARDNANLLSQWQLLDNTQDAIIVRDLNNKIIYWNNCAERLYGWNAAEVIGAVLNDQIIKQLSLEAHEAERETLVKGSWQGELQQLNRNGNKITVQSCWQLLESIQPQPLILISNLDISDKKKLMAQFLHAQRMENIGILAGGIAHDLNNVLAPIMMAIQILRRKYHDPDGQHLINTLEQSAVRGADMVKQVLSFVRGIQGERVIINIKYLINDIEKILNQTFSKIILIEAITSDNLWPITADATQLYQVLMNIAINARDAMPRGGKLSIYVENILIDENYIRMNSEANVGQYLLLTITDTGEGISPALKEKIFEPFFTTKASGTGLGLSTAASIIKSHGGFINLYSEPGKGTQFKIYLPAVPTTATNTPSTQSLLPHGQGELIMVVDDEVSIREIARQTLEAYGYRVIVAGDGTEAMALYADEQEPISCVLLDMMMPYMDGPTTIRALQKLDPQVKIIAASGLSTNHQIANKNNLGTQGFLTKPYTAQTLLEAIAKVLKEGGQ